MLDIFKEVIQEASFGRIKIGEEYYNIIFNTIIPEDNINIQANYKNNNIFVPTLIINNKKRFEDLLKEYIILSKEYFGENTKKLITLLWSNATLEDYNNPNRYLEKRIDFIKNSVRIKSTNYYLEELKSSITINNKKSSIYSETPSYLDIILNNELETYDLPRIYYGISDNVVYIYAIQSKKNSNLEKTEYKKYIKRKLYSINEGLDVSNDTKDNYGVGNLKDITPSFLLSSTIATIIFKNNGINKIVIPSFLISRWNAKEIAFDIKEKYIINNIEQERENHNLLQENLTDKLLRVFRRIDFISME